LFYLHRDRAGNLTEVTDEGGALVGRARYDAFGQILSNTIPPSITTRLYAGAIHDSDTGLYKIGARWYDPIAGVWLTPDAVVPDVNNPIAWNPYAFNYQNPVNYSDPSGHFPIWDILDIGSFFLSARDFISSPSLANLGWLALDAVSLLPFLPSLTWVRRADDTVRVVSYTDEVVEIALHGDDAARLLDRSFYFGELSDEEVALLRKLSAENDTSFIITGGRAETTLGRQNRNLALEMANETYTPEEIFARTGVPKWRNRPPTGKLELDYFTSPGQGGLPRRARRALHRRYDTLFNPLELDNWAKYRSAYGHRAPGGIIFDRGRVYRNYLEPWQYTGVLNP
jgi:RHS repeat-associated protein